MQPTQFEKLSAHLGHDIQFVPYLDEQVVIGVDCVCRTCNTRIFLSTTTDYRTLEHVRNNRAARLDAMPFAAWANQFEVQNEQERLVECFCDTDPDGCTCQTDFAYEGSEVEEFYQDYLKTLQPPVPPAPASAGQWGGDWDTAPEMRNIPASVPPAAPAFNAGGIAPFQAPAVAPFVDDGGWDTTDG